MNTLGEDGGGWSHVLDDFDIDAWPGPDWSVDGTCDFLDEVDFTMNLNTEAVSVEAPSECEVLPSMEAMMCQDPVVSLPRTSNDDELERLMMSINDTEWESLMTFPELCGNAGRQLHVMLRNSKYFRIQDYMINARVLLILMQA